MITVVDIRNRASVPPATEARLRAIHEEAFPPEEQQYSMDYMLGQVGRLGSIFRIIMSAERVAGYAYLELSPETATAFFWYIAVDPALRNNGIGRFAIDDTVAMLRREHPDLRYVLFEVHTPLDHHDQLRQTLDQRRIGFYRRLGAYWVRGVDYRIPAADDARRSIAYDPMFFALRDKFDENQIRDGVLLMAADNFEDSPDDPRWLSLRQSVERATIASPADRVNDGPSPSPDCQLS